MSGSDGHSGSGIQGGVLDPRKQRHLACFPNKPMTEGQRMDSDEAANQGIWGICIDNRVSYQVTLEVLE